MLLSIISSRTPQNNFSSRGLQAQEVFATLKDTFFIPYFPFTLCFLLQREMRNALFLPLITLCFVLSLNATSVNMLSLLFTHFCYSPNYPIEAAVLAFTRAPPPVWQLGPHKDTFPMPEYAFLFCCTQRVFMFIVSLVDID